MKISKSITAESSEPVQYWIIQYSTCIIQEQQWLTSVMAISPWITFEASNIFDFQYNYIQENRSKSYSSKAEKKKIRVDDFQHYTYKDLTDFFMQTAHFDLYIHIHLHQYMNFKSVNSITYRPGFISDDFKPRQTGNVPT